ncbi:MAG: nuclear transport factor 2 family protein [Pseudomonadota bacterium]|nr:nuclear transport factor 2 family protein [Pseudomonadota bacterium]
MRLILAALALAAAPTALSYAQPVAAKESAAAVVQAHIDAYRSGNIDRFVATFSSDAVLIANGIKAKGRAQIKAFYASNFGDGAPSIRVTESGKVGDNIYIVTAYDFPDGTTMCCAYSEYVVRGGKITYLVTGN